MLEIWNRRREVYPVLGKKEGSFSLLAPIGMKMNPYTALVISALKRENLNGSAAFIIARIRLFSGLLEKNP